MRLSLFAVFSIPPSSLLRNRVQWGSFRNPEHSLLLYHAGNSPVSVPISHGFCVYCKLFWGITVYSMQCNGAWEAAVVAASGCQARLKTNSKNEFQRVSSCLGFFTWKRQARSQTFVKREKVPDWPQTCFFYHVCLPPYSEMHGIIVIRHPHTWTHSIQAKSTKLLLHSLQVCFDFLCL